MGEIPCGWSVWHRHLWMDYWYSESWPKTLNPHDPEWAAAHWSKYLAAWLVVCPQEVTVSSESRIWRGNVLGECLETGKKLWSSIYRVSCEERLMFTEMKDQVILRQKYSMVKWSQWHSSEVTEHSDMNMHQCTVLSCSFQVITIAIWNLLFHFISIYKCWCVIK